MLEIESVVHFLKPHLVNRKIKSVTLEKENILVNKTKKELLNNLLNRTIIDFKRRGKITSFLFDDGSRLYIHPRIVGQLITCPKTLPNKKAKDLTDKEIKNLFKAIQEVLKYYIEVNESVGYDEYLKGEGKDFENMHVLRLYDSKICPICKTDLERIRISSRGTVYCPNCQK